MQSRRLGATGPAAEELAAIEAAVPRGAGAGERYPAAQMRMLDSEPASGA
ncbi:MAG: hypothetical protein ACYC8V_07255 [Caulobacteraceae bacterium]